MRPPPRSPLFPHTTLFRSVLAERTEDPLRGGDQQPAEEGVAPLDRELRRAVPGVASLRTEANPWTDVAAAPEATRVADRQHVGDRDQRAYAIDLAHDLRLRIAILGQLRHGTVELADASLEIRQRR